MEPAREASALRLLFGSPEYAGTVNLVRLCASGKIEAYTSELVAHEPARQSDINRLASARNCAEGNCEEAP